jgi:hypothetical protein
MIFLCWNCRGLGNPRTVRRLCRLVKTKKPTLVFLTGTKVVQRKAEFLKFKLGFDNMFIVDCRGLSSGLMLLWNSNLDLEVKNYSQNNILMMLSILLIFDFLGSLVIQIQLKEKSLGGY